MLHHLTLFSNVDRPLPPKIAVGLNHAFKQFGVKVTHAKSSVDIKVRKYNDLRHSRSDLIIAFGGDGTVLQAAHRSRGSGIPILGVNTGHLGYLAPLNPTELLAQLEPILNGFFRVEQRSALEVTAFVEAKKILSGWALNDIVIDRSSSRLVEMKAIINHSPVTDYRADGIIACTATGSTAYNLSLGGPVIAPTASVITLTPKAPLTLTNRSLVMEGTSHVVLEPSAKCGPAHIETDGIRVGTLKADYSLCIHRSATTVPIAFLPQYNNYSVLGERLGWNKNNLHR